MKDISVISYEELSLKHRVIQWILVSGLTATSGIALFLDKNAAMGFFVVCMGCAIYLNVKIAKYLPYLLIFLLLILFQTVTFGIAFYFKTAMLQLTIVLAGLITAAVVGINFSLIYTRLIVYFSVISLVLFVPIYVYFPFSDFLVNHFPISYNITSDFYDGYVTHSIFFLSFPDDFSERVRNTGPFWEPGAFGGFLMFAFILNTLREKSLINKNNAILVVTIVSTFSTTAYIALFIFVAGYYAMAIKSIVTRVALVAGIVVGGLILYNTLTFLSPKIQQEFEDASWEIEEHGGNSHAASTILDWNELVETNAYIMAGRGCHPEIRYSGTDKTVIRTNGDTDQLVRWGIPFFLFYLFCIHKSLRKLCQISNTKTIFSILGMVSIILCGTSEIYFQYSYFWALFFLHVPLEKYLLNNQIAYDDIPDQSNQ